MLRLPPPPKPREQETRFETICRLAREQDVAGLKQLEAEDDLFLYMEQDDCSPLKLMALEGNAAAVQLLIKQFGLYGGDALRGYAEAGLSDRVNEILYLRGPHDFTNPLAFLEYSRHAIYVHQPWKNAAGGYACAGMHDLVDKVIGDFPAAIDAAIAEYAKLKNWDRVEDLILRGGSLDVDDIPVSALADKELRLRLMSLVNGENTRRKILALWDPWKADDEFEFFQPLKQAARINRIMHEYHLNFRQARALNKLQEDGQLQSVRTWLLEGGLVTVDRKENNEKLPGKIVRKLPLLPREIFHMITARALGLSDHDVTQILTGVRAQLFVSVAKSNAEKYAFGLFSATKYMSEQLKPMESYEPELKKLKQ